MNRRWLFAGVSVVSGCALMLQLTLTRIFSATLSYHFAFFAISLALFGGGVSGVAVFLLGDRLRPEKTAYWLSAGSLAFSVSTILAGLVIVLNPFRATSRAGSYALFAGVYLVEAIPFFFAGAVISLVIARNGREMSRLYLFDLAGASAGCLALIPALHFIGAVNSVLAVSLGGAVAAIIFAEAERRRWRWLLVTFAALLGSLIAYNLATDAFDLQRLKGIERHQMLLSKWNSFSHVAASGSLENDFIVITIDADAATLVVKNGGRRPPPPGVAGLAHELRTSARVLIIGAGGGSEVTMALRARQKRIVAVEVNPIVARTVMSSEPFRSYSGDIYGQPGVELVVDEGRSYVQRSREQFDIIQLNLVDTWAATAAGAFALSENHLYTAEAFDAYLDHLGADGLLSITRWYYEPPDQVLRLAVMAREALEKRNVDSRGCVVVLREPMNESDYAAATFLVSKRPFTPEELETIEAWSSGRFEAIYLPSRHEGGPVGELLAAEDLDAHVRRQVNDVSAPTDDRPFFFNSLRPASIPEIFEGNPEWLKTNLGTAVALALQVISIVLVAAFIIVPLLLSGRSALGPRPRERAAALGFFAAIGGGFILIEIALVQRCTLLLGRPVYTLAVVLFSLLLFSGIGSFLTRRIPEDRLALRLRFTLVVLVALAAAAAFGSAPLVRTLVALPLALRVICAVAMIAPMALVMGMPMPIGIRMLSRSDEQAIPWAWGLNGATSVTGSIAAVVIAMFAGFSVAMLTGAGLYAAALLLARRPADA